VSASEKVAKALASLIAASYVEAMKPTALSGEIVDIAAKHYAAALQGWQAEIVGQVGSALRQKEDEIDG
jgi:hemoglobin-like flavoprotein